MLFMSPEGPLRKLSSAFLFAITFLALASPIAEGCGDKLLVLGRGVKFADIASSYRGAIIIYIPDSLPRSAAINDPQFRVSLQKAGYKVRLVQQADVVTEDVQSGKYDILLVDVQDAARVYKQVTAAGLSTVVMPVVYEGTELNPEAVTPLLCVRKISGRNNSCVSTIAKVMESKFKRAELQRRAGN
jgi:hypothetical protein